MDTCSQLPFIIASLMKEALLQQDFYDYWIYSPQCVAVICPRSHFSRTKLTCSLRQKCFMLIESVTRLI